MKKWWIIVALVALVASSIACDADVDTSDAGKEAARENAAEAFEALDKGQRAIQDAVGDVEDFVNSIGE